MYQNKTPLEICLTSNVMTKSVPAIKHHPYIDYYKHHHPIVFSCDDKGVFSTTITKEYEMAQEALMIDNKQLFDITRQAIDFSFCSAQRKQELQVHMDKFWASYSE